ncbi:protection of telomeres protein 1-like isoform X2 [Dreissena polymorpha]|uniref:protection of telomeres protein 1-like isoform X2 n=1 Tax=Dreissena polymorpha TaxID=45954 RepID=UPI002265550E|nr:protection of telomeres protein 1-like isoform X2 [Dreissena polymorpha]
MGDKNKSKKVTYSYTTLNELRPNTKADVFGVVKFIKPPYKSRGSDYCTMISITDSSMTGMDDKLKCLLFAKEESMLPSPDVGDIVRFHRLSVSMFRDSLQGQSSPGFAWLVFSGRQKQPVEPKTSSSPTYSFTDSDKDKIRELRSWASKNDEFKENLCSFNDVATGCYFDIYCQVVSTSVIEAGVGRLLRVWDATQCLYNVREVSADSQLEDTQTDEQVHKRARGFIYDVSVFDDHFKSSSHIKPGDYVKFINLHASEWKDNNRSHRPAIEFCLHRGNSFGRCVRVVSADLPDLISLKQRQEIVALDNESFSVTGINSQTAVGNSSGNSQAVAGNRSGSNDRDDVETDVDNHVQYFSHATAQGDKNSVSEKRDNVESNWGKNNMVEDVIVISFQSQEASSLELGDKIDGTKATKPVTDKIRYVESQASSSKAGDTRGADKVRAGDTRGADKVRAGDTRGADKVRQAGDTRGADKVRQVGKGIATENQRYIFKRAAVSNARAEMTVNSNEKKADQRRCMVQTSTVVLDHPHVNCSQISAVLSHAVPYKFRVRAKMLDFHPKPDSAKTFLQLYCHVCHYLCPYPEKDTIQNGSTVPRLQIGSTFQNVPHFNCPQCFEGKDSLPALDSPPHLKYIFMLRFILSDETGMLMANIWKEDAVQLFQDMQPEDLLRKESNIEIVRDYLNRICPPNTALCDKPWIEGCLRSFHNACGTVYQMFDTFIV